MRIEIMGRVLAGLSPVSVCALFLLTAEAVAVSGGGGDGGCCNDIVQEALRDQDPEIAKRGLDFYANLKKESEIALVLLEALDDKVCSQYDCGDLESPVVQRLVKIARETLRQEAESSWQFWNYGINAFNAVLALAAFVISFFAYRASRK